MSKLLEVKHLSKKYHSLDGEIQAIDDISFDINSDEFIVIVGPSGCGKSTLISIIANLLDKSSGEIKFYKENPIIGYMFQEDALFDHYHILDNLLLGLKIQKRLNKDSKEYVIKLAKKYGLDNWLDKYPKDLSGGMKQRCALIRTLAIQPDLLILDEPFSALDYKNRLLVADDVYQMIRDYKKSTIMVTHDISEAISLADKVIVLSSSPSKIKSIYDISISKEMLPSERRNSDLFTKYYDRIWKDLNDV